jgi:hypothetical protein
MTLIFLPLIQLYVKYYNTNEKPFLPLCSSIAIKILFQYYKVFVKEGLTELEYISEENKNRFIAAGETYCTEDYPVDLVAKAAYALQLIATTKPIS